MTRRIVINWSDQNSINEAIKELEQYQKDVRDFQKKFCKELAEVGRQKAQTIYDSFYLEGFNEPVQCVVEETTYGAKLVANGTDVCFIEFGTGVEADGSVHEGYTFTPGSWSSSELGKGIFSELGYWFYNGTRFTGTPPAHAMTQAIAEMESKASEVAQKLKGELT